MKRRLIGLEGPLDEAQWHEVDRVLSGTAAYTFSMTSLLSLLSLIWGRLFASARDGLVRNDGAVCPADGSERVCVVGHPRNKALRQPPLSADEHSRRLRTLKKQSILRWCGLGA